MSGIALKYFDDYRIQYLIGLASNNNSIFIDNKIQHG